MVRHLIYGNNLNWLLNLNLFYKWFTTQLVLFDQSNNNGSIDGKMDGSVPEENHLLRCWG